LSLTPRLGKSGRFAKVSIYDRWIFIYTIFMKERAMRKIFYFLSLFLVVIWTNSAEIYAEELQDCFFSKSLHKTGEGMRYWYEAKDGFKTLTGIPYNDLGCKKCHATSCDKCHLKETKKGPVYSVEIAQKRETCLKCHARAKATFKIDESRSSLDVHIDAGMVCTDCHTPREIHGDGILYKSMRDPNAKDAACTNCHTKNSEGYPPIPETKSHNVHKNRLDCNACHVRNTLTCYNCHFGEFAKTNNKPQSFFGKVKEFLLLVKYKGKITSGNLQSLVSADNKPFIIYAPYFTHSVMSHGRKCEECHGTEAVNALASNKKFTVATFEDGKSNFYKGIIPLVPDLLNWPFLEKKDGKWVPFEPEQKPLIQMGLYVEPFTLAELKKLKMQYKYKK